MHAYKQNTLYRIVTSASNFEFKLLKFILIVNILLVHGSACNYFVKEGKCYITITENEME